MKTKYEIFIGEIACALEDHSYGTQWYFDFDEQTTVPAIEEVDCYPENGHKVLHIEPMSSRESFQIMEDFADSVTDKVDQEKLYVALNQRHPFSSFKDMLHYTGQRENWFAYKDERMKEVVEEWMKENEVVYENDRASCNSWMVTEYYRDDEEEEEEE